MLNPRRRQEAVPWPQRAVDVPAIRRPSEDSREGGADRPRSTIRRRGKRAQPVDRPADVGIKAQRIERLLNFLAQSDRAWDRDAMLGTVRRVYLNVMLASQDGRPEAFAGLDLDPELAQHLRDVNATNQRNDRRVEYRNFCVRKQENVDEGSSPEMLEWFYSKPRAS